MNEELARDYASYAKVDISSQMKNLHETIEDMMVRLEEFESIIGMVQTTGAECTSEHLPRLQSFRPELVNLCKRIDALQYVITLAYRNLEALETGVDKAEASLGCAGVSYRFLGIFNPISHLFTTKNPETLEHPTIFKTEDFFKKE